MSEVKLRMHWVSNFVLCRRLNSITAIGLHNISKMYRHCKINMHNLLHIQSTKQQKNNRINSNRGIPYTVFKWEGNGTCSSNKHMIFTNGTLFEREMNELSNETTFNANHKATTEIESNKYNLFFTSLCHTSLLCNNSKSPARITEPKSHISNPQKIYIYKRWTSISAGFTVKISQSPKKKEHGNSGGGHVAAPYRVSSQQAPYSFTATIEVRAYTATAQRAMKQGQGNRKTEKVQQPFWNGSGALIWLSVISETSPHPCLKEKS